MLAFDRRLAEMLRPIREASLGAMLGTLAEAIDTGAEVEPEPMRRDVDGKVVRSGALSLPERGDLLVRRGTRALPQRIESPEPQPFAPLSFVADGGFTVVVGPFRWFEAAMVIEARQAQPNWTPLRHWALEWLQSRHTDVWPELAGAIHRLDGPVAGRGAWRFTVDFGSAPIEAVTGLVGAVAETGASRLRLELRPEP